MKNKWIPLFFLCALVGCYPQADKKSDAIFTQIKDQISPLSEGEIYWNSDSKVIEEVSLEELLKEDLTVEKVVQIALLNNPSLQAEYEKIGIASAKYRQAGLLQNPFFMFNYQFASSSASTDQINLNIIQNFLEIFLLPLKKKVASQEILLLKNDILEKIVDLIAQTKIAFHTVQIDHSILDLRKKIAELKHLSYEAALLLRCAGNTSPLFIAEKKMEFERAKLALTTAENAFFNSKEDLNVLMGVWGKDIHWSFDPHIESLSTPSTLISECEKHSIQNNFQLKNRFERMKQRAAELSIDTTSLLFPEISFGYSSNYQDYVWCIGPQVSINLPLFDIGKVQSMKAKAEIAYLWKQFTSEAVTLRSIVRRATDNFYYCHNQALLIEEQILPTVQKVFNETIIQHNALNLSLFDLLQAKEEVFEKQITLLEKQSQLYRKTLFLQALSRGVVLSENF